MSHSEEELLAILHGGNKPKNDPPRSTRSAAREETSRKPIPPRRTESNFDIPVVSSSRRGAATTPRNIDADTAGKYDSRIESQERNRGVTQDSLPSFPPAITRETPSFMSLPGMTPMGNTSPATIADASEPDVDDNIDTPNYRSPIASKRDSRSDNRHSIGIVDIEPEEDNYDDDLDMAAEYDDVPDTEHAIIDYHPSPFMSALALAMFFPTGFVSAGYDKEVTWHSLNGDHDAARSSAKKSIIWAWVSIILGIILFMIAGVLVAQAYDLLTPIKNWFGSA